MPKAKESYLRKVRLERGLTIEKLAYGAGLKYSTVQAIESGRLKGNPTTWQKLADVLRIDVRLLMTADEQKALYGDGWEMGNIRARLEAGELSQQEVGKLIGDYFSRRQQTPKP